VSETFAPKIIKICQYFFKSQWIMLGISWTQVFTISCLEDSSFRNRQPFT